MRLGDLLVTLVLLVVSGGLAIGFGQMSWASGGKAVAHYRAGNGTYGEAGSASVTRTEISRGTSKSKTCYGTFHSAEYDGVKSGLRLYTDGDCSTADLSDVRLVPGDTSGRIAVDDPAVIVAPGGGDWLTEGVWTVVFGGVTAVCGVFALIMLWGVCAGEASPRDPVRRGPHHPGHGAGSGRSDGAVV